MPGLSTDPHQSPVFETHCDSLGHKDKEKNGDAAALDPSSAGRILLAVADGVSSSPSDHDASRCACDAALAHLQAAVADAGRETLLEAAVEAAHLAVVSLPEAIQGSLTTLLLAEVDRQDGSVVFLSIGDSRVYRIGAGEPTCLTQDDSTTQIVRKGGKPWIRDGVVVTRKFLTQAVGQVGALEIRIQQTQLGPGEMLVLATDGFHELPQFLSRLQVLQRYLDLPSATGRVLMEHLAAAGHDDGTVGLVRRIDHGPREAGLVPDSIRSLSDMTDPGIPLHLAGRILLQRMHQWSAEGRAKELLLAVEAMRELDIWPSRKEVFHCAGLLQEDGRREIVVAWQRLVDWAGHLLEGTDGAAGG